MKILAVDTSCDESCAAVLDTETWQLCSDVVFSHMQAMAKYGGVVPEIASREHLKALPLVIQKALDDAQVTFKDIDWFTVTHLPGLMGALLVGVSYVKALAFSLNKPFTAMNHIEAHLYSPLLGTTEGIAVPPFPWTALVVSGGHTELFHVKDVGEYLWLGGTLDDAAGEAFDKIGKCLAMGYPAGPFIDRWVREKATPEHRARFKFPRADTPPFQFSYSGLKTAVALQARKLGELTDDDRLALVASAQEAILEPLVMKVREALKKFPESRAVVTGGVACNSRLRELLPEAYFPKPKHCTDNAAMVAILSGLYAKADRLQTSPWNTAPQARFEPEI